MGVLLILLAAFGYATVALFGRWIFDAGLPMYTVLSWRFGGSALLLWGLSKWQKQREEIPSQKKKSCFLLGFFVDLAQTSVFFFCIARLGASIAALLLYTFPLFVFLIERFAFRRRATRLQWLALCLTLLGSLLVIDPLQKGSAIPHDWIGIGFGIASGVIYAIYICFGAHITRGISSIASSSYLTRGAFFGFALIAFLAGELRMPASSTEWLLTLLIVLFATLLPLLCLVKGMQLIGATRTSLVFTVEPVVTICFAILFFGESLTLLKLIGSLLILSSALLMQIKPAVVQEESL